MSGTPTKYGVSWIEPGDCDVSEQLNTVRWCETASVSVGFGRSRTRETVPIFKAQEGEASPY